MPTISESKQDPEITFSTAEIGFLVSLINQRIIKASEEGTPEENAANFFRQHLLNKLIALRERSRATGEPIKLELSADDSSLL